MRRIVLLAVLALTASVLPTVSTAAAPAASCNTVGHFDRDNGVRTSSTTRYFTSMPSLGSSTGCTLSPGGQAAGVRYLKAALNRCHGSRLVLDTNYDRQTSIVVYLVRQSLSLPASYGYDATLARAMFWPMIDDITGADSCQRIRFSTAAVSSSVAAAALPVCNLSSRLRLFVSGGGSLHRTVPFWYTADADGSNCYEAAGANNRGVMYLKAALNRCHGFRLGYSWKFDYATHVAVNTVRRRLGLPQNGRYDPDLLSRMAWPKDNDLNGTTRC